MPQMIHFIQNSIQAQCLYRGKMKYVFDFEHLNLLYFFDIYFIFNQISYFQHNVSFVKFSVYSIIFFHFSSLEKNIYRSYKYFS